MDLDTWRNLKQNSFVCDMSVLCVCLVCTLAVHVQCVCVRACVRVWWAVCGCVHVHTQLHAHVWCVCTLCSWHVFWTCVILPPSIMEAGKLFELGRQPHEFFNSKYLFTREQQWRPRNLHQSQERVCIRRIVPDCDNCWCVCIVSLMCMYCVTFNWQLLKCVHCLARLTETWLYWLKLVLY